MDRFEHDKIVIDGLDVILRNVLLPFLDISCIRADGNLCEWHAGDHYVYIFCV